MKKLLLLGDSIRMGYQAYVREYLEGRCEVFYDEGDNGRFAAYTFYQANQMYRRCGPFDIVHWNNGYWDMDVEPPRREAMHPLDEYLHYLRRTACFLKENGAQAIFATTLPVPSEGQAEDTTGTGARFRFKNEWVERYNAAARALMAQEGVAVNDLYALMLREPLFGKCEDMLHLTESASRLCARQIARMVEERL